MKVLLVTVIIGDDKYYDTYEKLFKQSQLNYAKKHGYDHKIIRNFIDDTYKDHEISLYFQKSLVCRPAWAEDYDFIIYVDNDIYININSPPIHSTYDFGSKVGVVDEYMQPNKRDRDHVLQYWQNEDANKDLYYVNVGIDPTNIPFVINSGVLVFQPKKHRDVMNQYYNKYMQIAREKIKKNFFEQASLARFLFDQDLYFIMETKFNAIWNWTRSYQEIMRQTEDLEGFFHSNYFIHFAGKVNYDRIPSLHRHNVEHGQPIAPPDPDTLICSLGCIPHMSAILERIGKSTTVTPFDSIYCDVNVIIKCIEDDFASFLDKKQYNNGDGVRCGHTYLHNKLFPERDPRNEKDYQYYVQSVNNFRALLSSNKPKKFFIMKENDRDDKTYNKFYDDIMKLSNLLEKHTKNFKIYAITQTVSSHDSTCIKKYYTNIITILDIHLRTWGCGKIYHAVCDDINVKGIIRDACIE